MTEQKGIFTFPLWSIKKNFSVKLFFFTLTLHSKQNKKPKKD